MRRFVILIVLFLVRQGFTIGQVTDTTLTITGHITDADGFPVEYGIVKILGTSRGTVADSAGEYVIHHVPPSSYMVRASGIDMRDSTISLVVESTSAGSSGIIQRNFILPFPHCPEYDTSRAFEDVAYNTIRLVYSGGIAPVVPSATDSAFESTYDATYQLTPCTFQEYRCLRRYYAIVFPFLDRKYGRRWRNDAGGDVKSWLSKIPYTEK